MKVVLTMQLFLSHSVSISLRQLLGEWGLADWIESRPLLRTPREIPRSIHPPARSATADLTSRRSSSSSDRSIWRQHTISRNTTWQPADPADNLTSPTPLHPATIVSTAQKVCTSFVHRRVYKVVWTLYYFTARVHLKTCKLSCTLAFTKLVHLWKWTPFMVCRDLGIYYADYMTKVEFPSGLY